MVDGLASAWLKTAARFGEETWSLPKDFGPRVPARRKGLFDVHKCSAFSALREQSRGNGFAEEQPLTSVRLRSARPAQTQLALACLGWLDEVDLRFGDGHLMSPMVATLL
jgi:hypothetical protein